jgi:hypothetical protein
VTAPAAHRDQARRPSSRLIGLALVLAALAIVALAGGLRHAPAAAADATTAAVSDTVDSGLWTAAVTEATAMRTFDQYVPQPGSWLLSVVIRVDARGPDGRTAADLDRIASLPGQPGLTEPTPRWVVLRRDASELGELNPDLPEAIAYLFEVDNATPVPSIVTVQLSGYRPHYVFATRRLEWTDFGPLARVVVPVRNAR